MDKDARQSKVSKLGVAMTKKANGTAYALWALGLIGIGGLHRFYVGKTSSGLLYLFTFNLFFVGLVLDFPALPSMVTEANGGPGSISSPQPPVVALLSKHKKWAIAIVVLGLIGMMTSRKPKHRAEDARRATNTETRSRTAEAAPAIEGGVGPTAQAQAQGPQDEVERNCGFSPGQHPQFVKRKSERYDVANVRRVQVRITVPPGLSREELAANVCVAASRTYRAAGPGGLGAVAVLAYASEKVDGMYTAANGEFAPEGKWAKADPKVPLSKWSLSIEYAESYFAHSAKADETPNVATSPPRSEETREAKLPPGTFRTKEGYFGALSEEKLDEAFSLAASNDNAALEELIGTGAVFQLKGGLEVTVVDREGFLSSKVKLRKRGTLIEFWTVREALVIP